MARSELGTKRICPNCATRYYDLGRDPIVCPKCGTPFDTAAARIRPAAVREQAAAEEDEGGLGPDFVPLEEAEPEGDAVVADDIDGEEVDKDIEGDDFLEETEDEGDVADILPGVEDEEER